MPATIQGDYSRYPEPIRDVMPYLCGEIWYQTFHELFMADQQRLKEMGDTLSHPLWTFQQLLQDPRNLSIARLFMDKAVHKLDCWFLH